MELLTVSFFLFAIPAVIFAGISKGGFGSGAAFASASILAVVIPPGQALGLMLPLLMLIDVASLKAYWKQWSRTDATILILGSIPGIVFGAVFYSLVSADAIRLLIGAICLTFVAWQLAQSWRWVAPPKRGMSRGEGLAAGAALGFTSFVSHAGGPVAAVYLLSRNLAKTTYQATTVLVFWAVNVAKFGIYAALGIFTMDTLTVDLVLAPFALLGTWLGVKLHRVVPERLFFAITYVLLTVTGCKLIWDAVT